MIIIKQRKSYKDLEILRLKINRILFAKYFPNHYDLVEKRDFLEIDEHAMKMKLEKGTATQSELDLIQLKLGEINKDLTKQNKFVEKEFIKLVKSENPTGRLRLRTWKVLDTIFNELNTHESWLVLHGIYGGLRMVIK